MSQNNKALTGNIFSIFFSFSIPTVLGMLAITSAGIIDGMFVGKFVGTDALAAVSLCAPIYSLLFGVPILFSTGGEVFCGKFIGEGNIKKARATFTSILLIIGIFSLVITIFGLLFTEKIALILGADEKIKAIVIDYLTVIIALTPVMSCYALTYFIRVDGRPNLSFTSLLLVAIANIILDYIFIVHFQLGVQGAALGTSISYFILPLLLLPHFFSKKGNLSFYFNKIDWNIIKGITYNGSSEFLSELSGGILFFVINIQMIKYYGTDGVAAFAIVGYLIYLMIMFTYGMSDALKSIVSLNYGAKLMHRVIQFFKLSLKSSFVIGGITALITYLFIDGFSNLFLDVESLQAKELTVSFTIQILPVLFILGLNILSSSFFTALHHPKPSLIISLLRTLFLPVGLIFILTYFYQGHGIIPSIVAAESITLIVVIGLYLHYYKSKEWIDEGKKAFE